MKKLLVVAVAFALAGMVQASELWWTVSTADSDVPEWNTAKLFANTGATKGFNYLGTEIGSSSKEDLDDFGGAFTDVTGKDSSAYSFYVELFNGDTSTGYKTYVSTSAPQQGGVAGDDSVLAASIAKDTMDWNGKSVYTGFSQFTTSDVVPEPTSGLLVAFGMMLFGLKRKRV